jgi:hypothetical protein
MLLVELQPEIYPKKPLRNNDTKTVQVNIATGAGTSKLIPERGQPAVIVERTFKSIYIQGTRSGRLCPYYMDVWDDRFILYSSGQVPFFFRFQ